MTPNERQRSRTSLIKSVVYLLIGAFLASLFWYYWIYDRLKEEASTRITEMATAVVTDMQLAECRKIQMSGIASFLSMDLILLDTPPDHLRCKIGEFADTKYRILQSNRSEGDALVQNAIEGYEALAEDQSCLVQSDD